MQSATNESSFPAFPVVESDDRIVAESQVVRLEGAPFIRLMIARYGFPWIASAAGLLIASAVLAGVHDVRWLLIMLMTILLVFPFLAAYFYFNHGMKEVTVLNAFPHRLIFINRGVVVTLHEDDGPLKSMLIPYSEMDKYYIASGCIIVPMRNQTKGFLWIPSSGFETDAYFREAVGAIGNGLRKLNTSTNETI